jgi:hypothetical protein
MQRLNLPVFMRSQPQYSIPTLQLSAETKVVKAKTVAEIKVASFIIGGFALDAE